MVLLLHLIDVLVGEHIKFCAKELIWGLPSWRLTCRYPLIVQCVNGTTRGLLLITHALVAIPFESRFSHSRFAPPRRCTSSFPLSSPTYATAPRPKPCAAPPHLGRPNPNLKFALDWVEIPKIELKFPVNQVDIFWIWVEFFRFDFFFLIWFEFFLFILIFWESSLFFSNRIIFFQTEF